MNLNCNQVSKNLTQNFDDKSPNDSVCHGQAPRIVIISFKLLIISLIRLFPVLTRNELNWVWNKTGSCKYILTRRKNILAKRSVHWCCNARLNFITTKWSQTETESEVSARESNSKVTNYHCITNSMIS